MTSVILPRPSVEGPLADRKRRAAVPVSVGKQSCLCLSSLSP